MQAQLESQSQPSYWIKSPDIGADICIGIGVGSGISASISIAVEVNVGIRVSMSVTHGFCPQAQIKLCKHSWD